MAPVFLKRAAGIPIGLLHGTASFAGGLFKDHFPSVNEVIAVLRALIAAADKAGGDQAPIELEGAVLYGFGHEQLVLGRALAMLTPEERARFGYVTKVGRILVTKTSGLTSGQPPGIWPPGATEGPRVETWGMGRHDTQMTLAYTTLLIGDGNKITAAYLHDPPDCMEEMKLSFDQWWSQVNGGDTGEGGVIRALREAKQNGIIGEIGLGVKDVEIVRRILARDLNLLDRVSVTRYSLMSQAPLLDLVDEYSVKKREQPTPIKLIAAGPYGGGILSRDPRKHSAGDIYCNYRHATEWEIKVGRYLWQLAEEHGMSSPMPAALQFVARQPWLSGMVLGPRGPEDVAANARYLGMPIAPQFWSELNDAEIDGKAVIDRRAIFSSIRSSC